MQQHITITVEVPDGWEATGEYRKPCMGEWHISGDSMRKADCDFEVGRYIILRRAWTPPKWLKDGVWIAMDKDGKWWMYAEQPTRKHDEWMPSAGSLYQEFDDRFFDFTPPPCTDWRKSLRQIRHEK